MFSAFVLVFIGLSVVGINSENSGTSGKVCGNIDIRNNVVLENIKKLKDCNIINGTLQIVLIEKEDQKRLDDLSFPALTEIADYLLIYHVKHVTTLKNWFPNLKYIRGRTLFEGNAIIVRDLPDLVHLGLHSLQHVRGGVRIEDNKNLCLDQTPDFHIIAEAIKSRNDEVLNPSKTQILPEFALKSRHPNELNAKWNHTLVLNNQTINHFYIKLIEFEDLEFYYKSVQKYKCPADSVQGAHHLTHSDKGSYCGPDAKTNFIFGRVDNYTPKDVLMSNESESIINDIQIQVFKTNRFMDVSQSKNGLKSTSDKRTKFDQRIYHIIGVNRHPLAGILSRENCQNLMKPNCLVNTSSAVKWDDHVKHFRDYYVIVSACNRQDNCFVVAHQKNKTAALEGADDITEDSVITEVNDTDASVRITWSEPERPNGAIISYGILLWEAKNKTNKKSFCVNRWQYMESKGFVINNLKENTEYVFNLRAVSMNGPNKKWTKDFNFTIERIPESSDILKWSLIAVFPLLFFVFSATFCYFKYPSKSGSQIDIVSVNPEYESIRVDPDWEVNRADLKLFQVLGDGAFGRVYYGELRTNNKVIKCAVKTLNPNPRTQQRESFLKEANIMKSFIDCHHIVSLIGIVSVDNPVLVLMEYMINGDLKTYLRMNRPDNDENPNPRVPTINRIFQMAIEISDGMAYLAARKFVHRDLAARNCMVAEDLTVKIGDFGMTRDIYDSDYYRKRDAGLIPVRWMSPEALKDGVFNTYSDIWAYGVVLWEIVTLGAQPYQGCSNETVFQNVIRGMRLTEPENCPKKLWRIMQFCWRKNPRSRPSFNEITEYLLPLANQSFREACYLLNRKPFVIKEQPLKKLFYSMIPMNRLLSHETKHSDIEDFEQQYCQMRPQIQRKSTQLIAKEYSEQEIEILNKLNEINAKAYNDDMKSSMIIDDKKIETPSDVKVSLIDC